MRLWAYLIQNMWQYDSYQVQCRHCNRKEKSLMKPSRASRYFCNLLLIHSSNERLNTNWLKLTWVRLVSVLCWLMLTHLGHVLDSCWFVLTRVGLVFTRAGLAMTRSDLCLLMLICVESLWLVLTCVGTRVLEQTWSNKNAC